jgi:uncharacterized protein (TIGR02246 family)
MATQIPPTGLREGIRAGIARFTAAFERRDAAEMAACYTADAQVLPPESDEVRGRAAIEAFWRAVIELGHTGARLETLEATGLGDEAYEVGRYTLLGEGEYVADHGKYVVIWRFMGGRWMMDIDIWNTSVRPGGN